MSIVAAILHEKDAIDPLINTMQTMYKLPFISDTLIKIYERLRNYIVHHHPKHKQEAPKYNKFLCISTLLSKTLCSLENRLIEYHIGLLRAINDENFDLDRLFDLCNWNCNIRNLDDDEDEIKTYRDCIVIEKYELVCIGMKTEISESQMHGYGLLTKSNIRDSTFYCVYRYNEFNVDALLDQYNSEFYIFGLKQSRYMMYQDKPGYHKLFACLSDGSRTKAATK